MKLPCASIIFYKSLETKNFYQNEIKIPHHNKIEAKSQTRGFIIYSTVDGQALNYDET